MMKNSIGLYIHIPFCAGKCPYCDFYSVDFDEHLADRYTETLIGQIGVYSRGDYQSPAIIPAITPHISTIYFGGGTPSLMGAGRIARIMNVAHENFHVSNNAEITLELNPCTATPELMRGLAAAGINRLSVGMQSGADAELRALGRRHTAGQTPAAADMARRAGINNISLDWMLGIPGQTEHNLGETLRMIEECAPAHVSAYLLKIEPGTPFGKKVPKGVPGGDEAAGIYLAACAGLESLGMMQYEISNFARRGYESRHNLNYWNCGEYLGLGPAAHSFIGGRRFFYPPSLDEFMSNPETVDDGEGGGEEEYAMLRLRLSAGLTEDGWRERYGGPIPDEYRSRAAGLAPHGLAEAGGGGVRLTRRGFLLSNEVITRIIG